MAPTDHPGKAAPRHAIIVAGPTCSGKSALAIHLAERFGGTVVNADSMQIYRELRIVTARPTEGEEARGPHRLSGTRAAAEAGSVAWWRAAALQAMAGSRMPILCGGTGMYLRSLTAGLADIPDPGEAARGEARSLLAQHGPAALHAGLAAVDPQTAARLRPSDGQRIARAWEVWRGTGRGLAEWLQAELVPADYVFHVILLDPPRSDLRAAIARRFSAMLAGGALAEVERLMALGLDPALPAMQAHGVPELSAALQGKMSLEEAEHRAVLASAQYMKRQATWFRHQVLAPVSRLQTLPARFEEPAQLSERWVAGMQKFLCGFS